MTWQWIPWDDVNFSAKEIIPFLNAKVFISLWTIVQASDQDWCKAILDWNDIYNIMINIHITILIYIYWYYPYHPNVIIQNKEEKSYLDDQNILQKKIKVQLMKYTAIQDRVVEVFLSDKHKWTNLAWETGQLIPSYDFDIVCWLVILGEHKEETTLSISVWLQNQFRLTLPCHHKSTLYF